MNVTNVVHAPAGATSFPAVLIVHDAGELASRLQQALGRAGFHVTMEAPREGAARAGESDGFDVIIVKQARDAGGPGFGSGAGSRRQGLSSPRPSVTSSSRRRRSTADRPVPLSAWVSWSGSFAPRPRAGARWRWPLRFPDAAGLATRAIDESWLAELAGSDILFGERDYRI
mgnify:FL=1